MKLNAEFQRLQTKPLSAAGTVESKKDRRRLLFIGTLDVAPTYGGPIQFHRHFVERGDFSFRKLIEPSRTRLAYLNTGLNFLDRALDRASKTRLFPHFAALNEWLSVRKAVSGLMREALALKPQAVVTVAFGAYGFAAAYVAKRLNVPLITFFHDWWPDLALESRLGIRAFDWRMRRLYRQSDLALCVCDEMKEELGAHPNARILYPIPAVQNGSAGQLKLLTRPRLIYLGGMTRGYGRMLAALSRAYVDTPGARPWELAIFGDTRDWPAKDVAQATRAGVYRGLCYGDAAQNELAKADIFLVVMDFESATKRRVRTSFPSKLLEYCAYGKPVIAWAPEYSSIAGFARRVQFPFLHSKPDARKFVKSIDEFVREPGQMFQNAALARELGTTTFSADHIHAQLVALINQALNEPAGSMINDHIETRVVTNAA
jgi:Glycosyltransferase Family 4/Glycosyl transferases group 1